MSKAIYDAGASVLLKADGSAAITSTASTSAVDFDMSAGGTFAVAVNVEALDATTGDETYTISVVGQDSAGANDVTLATFPVVATGEHLFALDAGTVVKQAGASVAKVLLTATLAGTTPSLTYSAWIQPVRGLGRP